MLGENIKRFRKSKGLSQEEVAVRLNVVRQTVSKWESGLSVPDADVLILLAELFEVSVGQLLGIAAQKDETRELADELARVNEELAARSRRERQNEQANAKRGLILFLSFLSMLVALVVKNEMVSAIVFGCCALFSLFILYRNLALLTSVTNENVKMGTLRMTTVFDIVVIVVVMGIVILNGSARTVMTEEGEKGLAMAASFYAHGTERYMPLTRPIPVRRVGVKSPLLDSVRRIALFNTSAGTSCICVSGRKPPRRRTSRTRRCATRRTRPSRP